MYIKRVELENYGPFGLLDLEFGINEDGNPKPTIIVGRNGSGKSILLSHIVNSLTLAKEHLYPNSEIEAGKVYKIRSPLYTTSGKHYSFAKVLFEGGNNYQEWVLAKNKKQFEDSYKYVPARKEWKLLKDDQDSAIGYESDSGIKKLIDEQCTLYLPPNRFEEPAWLNEQNLLNKPQHTDKIRYQGQTNRTLICHSPLKENINWMFDVILDMELYEKKILTVPINKDLSATVNVFAGHEGTSHNLYLEILKLLRTILDNNRVRFGIGNRQTRSMSIMEENEQLIPNIFQLSTGETALLNLFLSIIKDFDLSNTPFVNLESVTGIVVVDEIDAHLHTNLQYRILPKLIKLFPKVQFVITSHSPLFLLGMEEEFGKDAVDIIELPHGNRISTERFSEFEDAYNTIIQTEKFKKDIEKEVQASNKPLLIVEGSHDIHYLQKASELLSKQEILDAFVIIDGGGYGSLDKIWKNNKELVSVLSGKKLVLLYDCDTNKIDDDKGSIFKRVMPLQSSNPIAAGIENLFPKSTIEKAMKHKKAFIDIYGAQKISERGSTKTIPEEKKINKNEKTNMCEWLCKEGTKTDFTNFSKVFDMLQDILDK